MIDVLSIATDGYLNNRSTLGIAVNGYLSYEEIVVEPTPPIEEVARYGGGGSGIYINKESRRKAEDEEIIRLATQMLINSGRLK